MKAQPKAGAFSLVVIPKACVKQWESRNAFKEVSSAQASLITFYCTPYSRLLPQQYQPKVLILDSPKTTAHTLDAGKFDTVVVLYGFIEHE